MTQIRWTFRYAVVAVCAVVLSAGSIVGCGGDDSNQRRVGETKKSGSPTVTATGAGDTCSLLSEAEVADIVGNTVSKGRPFAGPADCKWDTEDPSNVDVLLIAHAAGSIREQVLCSDVGKADNGGQRVAGLGDIAVWKLTTEGSLFNSGELEICGPKGFVSLTLDGKRNEATLKEAAIAIARKVIERL